MSTRYSDPSSILKNNIILLAISGAHR